MTLQATYSVSTGGIAAALALALGGCATAPAGAPPAAATPAVAAAPEASAAAKPTPPAGPGSGLAPLPAAGSAPAAGVAPAGPPAPAAAPGALKPFAEVIKDAKRIEGLFSLWQKDDKVWLELRSEDLGQPLILSPKLKTGIGEGRFFGGLMGEEVVIEFKRVHNLVQMLARNTEFIAKAGTPNGRAVEVSVSPGLLASSAVLSQPHPERKSFLVEANPLFVNDMLAYGMFLQRAYRQGYALDARNSGITAVRATPDLVVIETNNHYAAANIAVPQPGGPPGAPAPSVPKSVPDARSLFLATHFSLARLPEQPMRPRRADPRVGYFTSAVTDFTDDLARSPRQRYVTRWRLEKKDPAAALSEPVKPITFWIDRTVPEKYRASMTAGVLEWNKAFEKIGFKDAVRVAVQPDDADWDTLDYGRASLRWMTNPSPSFGAIGPSHVDPRTGEILDADIGFESLSSRSVRTARSQILFAMPAMGTEARPDFGAASLRGLRAMASCELADQAAEQMSYAFDVLAARGELDPAGPEAEKFVQAYMKDVTMHEVGHTLGLRHNFRSSRVYTDAQVSDPAFSAANGITGSVMEYAPINLPPPGVPFESYGTPFTSTLGPYDYWAIEYAYKAIAPELEEAELQRIAGRSAEPALAYGTDEDNFIGVDPESLQFDLGSDPMAYVRKRVAIARDLLARQEKREIPAGQDYSVLRRAVGFALRDMGRTAGVLGRQIGGVRTLRDHPGTGRDPLLPVPAAQQRQALDIITTSFLAADSFRVSPALQRKLAIDFDERTEAVFRGDNPGSTDFSPAAMVLEMQRGLLNTLLSDTVTARLLDSEEKTPGQALPLRELHQRLSAAVWSELAAGDITPQRRELQREYANKLAALLLRPASAGRADARSLVRSQAQALLQRIEGAARKLPQGSDARAHLADSADLLTQALAARPQRAGV
jgi:hypothetical protein